MDNELRRQIIIKVGSSEEEAEMLDRIYNQLAGNQDYIENKIVLNSSKDRNDDTENEVHVYIFNDSETTPEIIIY